MVIPEKKCDFCEYQSIEKKNYEAHVMSHTGEKPFVCELCDFRCTRSQNLRSHHIAIHTVERPHQEHNGLLILLRYYFIPLKEEKLYQVYNFFI